MDYEYRQHPKFFGYVFRSDGTVWKQANMNAEITQPNLLEVEITSSESGTKWVRLKQNSKTKEHSLGKVLLEAFERPCPDSYRVHVGFRSGKKTYDIDNIYWTFIRPIGANEQRIDISEHTYFEVWRLHAEGKTSHQIASELYVKRTTILNILSGKIFKNAPRPRVVLMWPNQPLRHTIKTVIGAYEETVLGLKTP